MPEVALRNIALLLDPWYSRLLVLLISFSQTLEAFVAAEVNSGSYGIE